ncbi:hypothetical protein [Haloimpatiens lingqiaonensis]|uniref:hypothetical protein n=1 Tax=Haloimpatiens lingqiaonensis TaxID=1380675 RepID=UPI0010FE8B81|nr:hypothetical protein [Haloimpatiens lingqiaonensis]
MDMDIRKEIDIEDEYEMVPISPGEMNLNMNPNMNNYPMENNIDYDGMYNTPNMNSAGAMKPAGMINPMCPGNMNPANMPMMSYMMPCMMYCMQMAQNPMGPMGPMGQMPPQMFMENMQPPMMPFMMPNMGEGPMMPMVPEMESEMSNRENGESNEDEMNVIRYNSEEEKLRYRPKDVDKILREIERYNPGVFRMLRSYGVPYDEARRICRRIIRLTLTYYEK